MNMTELSILLSKQTAKKLDEALSKGNMEQLKKHMMRLFGHKNMYNLHDDHITELAECVVDLVEAEDRMACAEGMEEYAKRRISRYQERKEKLVRESQWAKAARNPDRVSMLDLTYRLWVYESGFEYSRYSMYTMLCVIINDIRMKEGST